MRQHQAGNVTSIDYKEGVPVSTQIIETVTGNFRVCLEGAVDAPVLVFSNSLGTTLEMWDAQAAHFSKNYRVLRYDTRGHGCSVTTQGPYTLAQLGGDVVALLDALDIARASFCGISMGGLTGLWLGVHAGDRLNHLVVCNSAPKIGTAEGWLTRAALVRDKGIVGMAELAVSSPSRWFTEAFIAAQPAVVSTAQSWIASIAPEGYAACCEALAEADVREALAGIRVPTLLIAGSNDPVTTVADSQFMNELISGSQVAEVLAAHLSNLEAPQAFSETVEAFLASTVKATHALADPEKREVHKNNLRWKYRPEGSTWGDFGPEDQLGRLNLLTPEKVRQGAAEVREGLAFALSLPLDYPGGSALNPNRHPPVLRPLLRKGLVNFNCLLNALEPGRTDVLSDDLAILHLQYSTQWDGLAHVGSLFDANGDGLPQPLYYNGYAAGRDVVGPSDPNDAGVPFKPGATSTSAAHALGIEGMARTGVQGRGVMVNLRAHLGDARTLVGYETLMRVIEADGVEVEGGDILCLHTGFSDVVLSMKKKPDPMVLGNSCAVLDGRDGKLLQWITDSQIAAIAADNYAVEAYPARQGIACCAALPLHEHCLFKLGVHLGELWHLTPLAEWLREHGRHRFLLTAPPLNLPGAIASPLTPVATV